MNYFSKYVNKFQQGGAMAQGGPDPQAVLMAIMVMPDAFVQADENLAEFIQSVQSVQSQEDIQNVVTSNPEAFQEAAQIYASNQDAFDQAIAQAQSQTSAYKLGGVIDYLDYLKCGGKSKKKKCSAGCSCKSLKPVKAEGGEKLKKVAKRIIGDSANKTPITKEQRAVPHATDGRHSIVQERETWTNRWGKQKSTQWRNTGYTDKPDMYNKKK